MLIRNGYRNGHFPYRLFMGEGTSIREMILTGRLQNLNMGEGLTDRKIGLPNGNLHPYSWQLPDYPGSMNAHNQTFCDAVATATIIDGRVLVANSTGTAIATAHLDQGVFVIGNSTGVATNNATLTFAPSKLVGTAAGTCTLSGTQSPLAWAEGVSYGTAVVELYPHALGIMGGETSPFTPLSPEALANSVWTTDLLNYSSDGTAGKAIKTIKGLVHENFLMKDQVYDVNDRLISATVRVFANATDCSNDVNPTDEYTISSSYGLGGVFRTVKV